MEFNWSLAAGDPISQPCVGGGGGASFNSSHNFHCPGAPCNSFESEFLDTEGEVFTLDANLSPLLPYSDSLGFTEYDATPSQSIAIPWAKQSVPNGLPTCPSLEVECRQGAWIGVKADEDCSLVQELDFSSVDNNIKINNPSVATTHCDGDINLLSFISKHIKSTVHSASDDHDTARISSEGQVQGALKTSNEAKGYPSSIPKDTLLPEEEASIDMNLCEKWHNRKRCRVSRPNQVISELNTPTHIVKGDEAGHPVLSSHVSSQHLLQVADDHTNQVHSEKGNRISALRHHVTENEAGQQGVSRQLASASSLGQREDFETQSCFKENTIDDKQQYLSQCKLSSRQQQFPQRLPLQNLSESNTNIQIIQHKLPKKDLRSFWQSYHDQCGSDPVEPSLPREAMCIDGVWMCPKLHRKPQIHAKQHSLDTWLL